MNFPDFRIKWPHGPPKNVIRWAKKVCLSLWESTLIDPLHFWLQFSPCGYAKRIARYKMAVAVSLQLRTLPVALLKQSTAGSQFYLSEQISITPHFTMASIGQGHLQRQQRLCYPIVHFKAWLVVETKNNTKRAELSDWQGLYKRVTGKAVAFSQLIWGRWFMIPRERRHVVFLLFRGVSLSSRMNEFAISSSLKILQLDSSHEYLQMSHWHFNLGQYSSLS